MSASSAAADRGPSESAHVKEENIRACILEVREVVQNLSEDSTIKSELINKLSNLEDCVFESEWENQAPNQPELKLAVLGGRQAGQSELLQRFLCGYVPQADNLGIKKKNPMEKLTGVKTTLTNIGKRHKTTVPVAGKDQTMLIRTAIGDPGPHVIKWADAFLVAFNTLDPTSLSDVANVYAKIRRYRREANLPCCVVEVQGLTGLLKDNATNPAEDVTAMGEDIQFYITNPMTGSGVDKLFHDVVHQIVEKVHPVAQSKHAGKLPKKGSNSNDSIQADISSDLGMRGSTIRQGLLRKHHAHGRSGERWVTLIKGAIVYYNSLNEFQGTKHAGKTIPLVGVTVKKSLNPKENPNFQIISLTGTKWKFETSDDGTAQAWCDAIQKEIEGCLNRNLSAGAKNNQSLDTKKFAVLTSEQQTALSDVDGNKVCADCGTEGPVWASLNMTVLVCIQCSGIHRRIGTHISRVRSLELDDWKPDHLDIMMMLGNAKANQVLEETLPNGAKLSSTASPEEREKYIRSKYEAKAFLAPWKHSKPPQEVLITALQQNPVADTTAFAALLSCNKEMLNTPVDSVGTALHVAARVGNKYWVQLLLWAFADPEKLDENDLTPLYYAQATKSSAHADIVDILAALGYKSHGPGAANVIASPSASPVRMQREAPAEEAPRGRTGTVWDKDAVTGMREKAEAARKMLLEEREENGAIRQASTGSVDIPPDLTLDPSSSGTETVTMMNDSGYLIAVAGDDLNPKETDIDNVEASAEPVPTTSHSNAENLTPPNLDYQATSASNENEQVDESATEANNMSKEITKPKVSSQVAEKPSQPTEQPKETATENNADTSVANLKSPAEIESLLKSALRARKVKLWEPPYTGANGESTVTEEVKMEYATLVGCDKASVAAAMEKLRAKAFARKNKKGTPGSLRNLPEVPQASNRDKLLALAEKGPDASFSETTYVEALL
eukprot:m.38995 g.38995  ORF g.38995 m.38995 type:complete len:956 (+) comp9502_c0_seq1:194-3061(+)